MSIRTNSTEGPYRKLSEVLFDAVEQVSDHRFFILRAKPLLLADVSNT